MLDKFRPTDTVNIPLFPVRAFHIANQMFPHPSRFPVAAKLNGMIVGLQTILPESGPIDLDFLFSDATAALEILRHSTAHLMARAVMRLFSNVKLGFGPAVDNGFYYDFSLDHQITEADFPMIEAEMHRLIAQGGTFECLILPRERAVKILEAMDQPMKLEHVNTNLKDLPMVYFYRQGEFLDLSRGPHVINAGMLVNFKLLSVTEANWKGDVQKPLQRIYGTAFFQEAALKKYLAHLKEARKRDHRILGKHLELYSFDPRVGSGLVLWLPKGAVIRQQLESFLADRLTYFGFQQVYSPAIGRAGLYRITGKNPYEPESSYPLFEVERNDCYVLRPTCGPHHVAIYQNHPRSYRELPLRLFEFGNVCRYEPSGELSGLKRVRAFTRNDAHIFCAPEQVAKEFRRCLEMLRDNLKTFGFQNLRIQTLFCSDNGVKYSGTPLQWDFYEKMILQECHHLGLPAFGNGEVHPEGPGIDFVAEDSLGRDWHFGTIHIDFNLPGSESFDLSYVGTDNHLHRPIMLHCTPLDSFERFIGVLIEHYAGAFPLWLAPEQVRILIVSPKHETYAIQIEEKLRAQGIRVLGDYRSEKIGAKIRRAQLQLTPYMIIIGEREAEGGNLAIRDRISGNLGTFTLAETIELFQKEIREKVMKYEPGTV